MKATQTTHVKCSSYQKNKEVWESMGDNPKMAKLSSRFLCIVSLYVFVCVCVCLYAQGVTLL